MKKFVGFCVLGVWLVNILSCTVPTLAQEASPTLIYRTFVPLTSHTSTPQQNSSSPYPASPVISSVKWDFKNLVRLAPGSDLWPTTWASDDNIYTSWGDGGGFGGNETNGRVSLGFARIEGSPDQFTGFNVWGGYNSENGATFEGKPLGLLSVDGVLYAWIATSLDKPTINLAWSADLSKNWGLADWAFPEDNFVPYAFLNFGKDYAGARDGYIYIYGGSWDGGKYQYLARVAKTLVRDRSSYEFFKGMNSDGNPSWTKDIKGRQPVFKDNNYVSGVHVVFNEGIGRYILTVGHHAPNSNLFGIEQLGIFDAPEPWGPWTTAAYYNDWGNFGKREDLGWHIPTKWISADGKTLWVLFSSEKELDSFNLVKATLSLK